MSFPRDQCDSNDVGDNDIDDKEDDAQQQLLARDMQLALDLQAREERRMIRRQRQRQQWGQQQATTQELLPNGLSADHMLFVSCALLLDDDDVYPNNSNNNNSNKTMTLLVDTGASCSAMSLDMVQQLGLSQMLNTSVQGSAQGVGTSDIVGIIPNVQLQFAEEPHIEVEVYFVVMATSSMPGRCILGLDQLRKYKCLVDLDSNALVFGGPGGVNVPFLPQPEAAAMVQQLMTAGAENATIRANPDSATAAATVVVTRQQDRDEQTLEAKIKSFFQLFQ